MVVHEYETMKILDFIWPEKRGHSRITPEGKANCMRIAALYDIHGNLPALEAVLDDVRCAGIDQIVVGGDIFPGPMAVESLELLQLLDIPTHFIRGNGDREVLALANGGESPSLPQRALDSMRWVAESLRPGHRGFISAWPGSLHLHFDDLGDVLFCHATPNSDTSIFTRLTAADRLIPVFRDVQEPIVVCGHTHMQFDRMIGPTRVINAGSVGMPFGAPAACWLLLGPDVQLRRTEYDLTNAANRIRATDYPHADDFAGRYILHPPSERQMLELYSKAELT